MPVTVPDLPPVASTVGTPAQLPVTVPDLPPVASTVGTPAQLPVTFSDLPPVASTVGTPTQLPVTVSDLPPVAASTVGTPAELPVTVSNLPPVAASAVGTPAGTVSSPLSIVGVPEASTVGITGIADSQTQFVTERLPSRVLADMQVHLQTPLQGVDGISPDAPLFPLYYKPTGEDWNGTSGGNGYSFGVQGFNDGFLGPFRSGYNMLTGPAQDAWLSAQNLGGTVGLEMNNWNFGTDLSTLETSMPRPTYHPLPTQGSNVGSTIEHLEQPRPTYHPFPMQGSNVGSTIEHLEQPRPTYHPLPMQGSNVGSPIDHLEQLGTRVRKPAGRKEVVPLTESTKSEDDGISEWMTLAIGYLKEGQGSKEWLNCVDAWIAFEKKIGVQSSTSVSTNCDGLLDFPTHKFLASLARKESP